MSTLAAGVSTTITIPAGQSLRFLFSGAFGTAVMGPGPRKGNAYPLSGGEVLGPYEGPQIVYLGCTSGTLSYDLGVRLADSPGFIGTFTFATLPDPTKYPNGTQAYTTDQGMVALQDGAWVQAADDSSVEFSELVGTPYDNPQLLAALGGVDLGGPSDASDPVWSETPGPDLGRAMSYKMDGITWVIDWHDDGRPNTETCGDLVRQWVYDGQLRPNGVNGPHFQGGALVLTYAQMIALVPTASGLKVKLSDAYPGMEFIYDQPNGLWMSPSGVFVMGRLPRARFVPGLNGATYSRAGNVVTVAWTAHGMSVAGNDTAFNGSEIWLPTSAGGLVGKWFTNYTRVDANTFTCVDTASGTIASNSLTTNTAETTVHDLVMKAKMWGHGGLISGDVLGICKGSGNAKQLRARWGGDEIASFSVTANRIIQPAEIELYAFNSRAQQIKFPNGSTSQTGDANADPVICTKDSDAADVPLIVTLRNVDAGDWCALVGSSWTCKQ